MYNLLDHPVEPSSSPMSVSEILMEAYAHLLLAESSDNFLELARHAPMHGLLTALRAVLHLDYQVRVLMCKISDMREQ